MIVEKGAAVVVTLLTLDMGAREKLVVMIAGMEVTALMALAIVAAMEKMVHLVETEEKIVKVEEVEPGFD